MVIRNLTLLFRKIRTNNCPTLNAFSTSSVAQNQDNLSAVLYGKNDIRMEQRPIPKPSDHQVLLKMEVVGICGSDVHYLVNGRIGPFVVDKPMVIGHEASGTVVECGNEVKNLKVGDRVAIEPGVPCGKCEFCNEGRYNLCPNVVFCATPPNDGNLCRFYVHDSNFCYKLPENVDYADGALMEPLSVSVHACKRGKIRDRDCCLVFGAGPIGLTTVLAAKAMGATKILVAELRDVRLNKALAVGATGILKIEKHMTDEMILEEIRNILNEDPRVVFDCTGSQQCMRLACAAAKTGGVVVLVGLESDVVQYALAHPVLREVDVLGSFRYCNDYQTALEMIASGKVNAKPLITHHFKLENTLDAFTTAITGKNNPIKILIHTNLEWNPEPERCITRSAYY